MRRTIPWLAVAVALFGLVGMTSCSAIDGPASGGSGSDAVGGNDVGTDSGGDERDTDDNSSCNGCIHPPSGTCVEGTSDETCGSGGEDCTECMATQTCSSQGTCVERECSSENCDGCCQNGECKEGTANEACGSGGSACTKCGDESRCVEQSCETCAGCFASDGTCKPGDTDAACGSGGTSCTECGPDKTCKNGSCVKEATNNCSQSCDGCCDGDQCKDGTAASACGTGGDVCQPCTSAEKCTSSGTCEAKTDTKWDIYVVGSKFSDSTNTGDQFTGPDPYAKVLAASKEGSTSVIHDTKEPHWNEKVIGELTAQKIAGSVTYHIRDKDDAPFNDDDPIVEDCEPQFTESDIRSGSATHTCKGGASPDNEATTEFRFEVASGSSS